MCRTGRNSSRTPARTASWSALALPGPCRCWGGAGAEKRSRALPWGGTALAAAVGAPFGRDIVLFTTETVPMRILGISAFYHDSAAALIEDGEPVAAAQEERFSRKKHDAGFPRNAIAYCLREGGITLDDVDHVVFYDKPFLKFGRLLETYI